MMRQRYVLVGFVLALAGCAVEIKSDLGDPIDETDLAARATSSRAAWRCRGPSASASAWSAPTRRPATRAGRSPARAARAWSST
ncbi:MAG: hypothetical protein M5U28_17800 [Sandaracinaceae bacterium]|nr:hypothetical protein [Sandaracinaceae bacterium]